MRKFSLEKLIFSGNIESKRDWGKTESNLIEELMQKGGKKFVGCMPKCQTLLRATNHSILWKTMIALSEKTRLLEENMTVTYIHRSATHSYSLTLFY